MYSNLRTEAEQTNHYLVPAAVQLFSYQKDLVQVVTAGAERIIRLAPPGTVIPFQELRALLTEAQANSETPVAVRYLRGGRLWTVPAAFRDSALALPASPLHLKFLRFRPIEAAGARRCTV
jgi:hypothetical protein